MGVVAATIVPGCQQTTFPSGRDSTADLTKQLRHSKVCDSNGGTTAPAARCTKSACSSRDRLASQTADEDAGTWSNAVYDVSQLSMLLP